MNPRLHGFASRVCPVPSSAPPAVPPFQVGFVVQGTPRVLLRDLLVTQPALSWQGSSERDQMKTGSYLQRGWQ